MKQAILVRQDLKLPKGKLAAQVAHASVEAVERSDKAKVKRWRSSGAMKIVLNVKGKDELFIYKTKAEDAGLTSAVITDAGHTVVEPGTITCMGIGPDEEDKVDSVCKDLKLA